jgi:hypothetical protein
VSWLDDFAESFTYETGHAPTLRILADKTIQTSPFKDDITSWSKDHVYNPEDFPMGSFDSKKFGDLNVVAQIQHHTWSHDKTGKKISGNFRGITLYEVK